MICRKVKVYPFLSIILLHSTYCTDCYANWAGENATWFNAELRNWKSKFSCFILDRMTYMFGIIANTWSRTVVNLAIGACSVRLSKGPAAANINTGWHPFGVLLNVARPSDHLSRHYGKRFNLVCHTTEVKVRFLKVNVRHLKRSIYNIDCLFSCHSPFSAIALFF